MGTLWGWTCSQLRRSRFCRRHAGLAVQLPRQDRAQVNCQVTLTRTTSPNALWGHFKGISIVR